MGKFVDFMVRWTEDLYRLRTEELNRWYETYGIHKTSLDDTTDTEPATSIEANHRKRA